MSERAPANRDAIPEMIRRRDVGENHLVAIHEADAPAVSGEQALNDSVRSRRRIVEMKPCAVSVRSDVKERIVFEVVSEVESHVETRKCDICEHVPVVRSV